MAITARSEHSRSTSPLPISRVFSCSYIFLSIIQLLGPVFARRQVPGRRSSQWQLPPDPNLHAALRLCRFPEFLVALLYFCLLYTSDAADDLTRVDLGGCRIIK